MSPSVIATISPVEQRDDILGRSVGNQDATQLSPKIAG